MGYTYGINKVNSKARTELDPSRQKREKSKKKFEKNNQGHCSERLNME